MLTADTVTAALRDLILKGSLGVGVQLKQEALAQRFGVSRIPVREALRRLQAEGLIEHTAHQGSVVATKSIPELLEILDIRIGLETRALKLAVPNMTRADLAAATEILRRYDASDSPREWTELNLAFHLALYRPSGRPRLVKMIEEIVRGASIHLRTHQSSIVGRKSSQTEHRALLRACTRGDVEQAVRLLEEHIQHTQRVLLEAEKRG